MGNFAAGDWFFYFLLFVDTALLIARDADLYDDFGKWIGKTCGRRATALLPMLALLAGQHDVLADAIVKDRKGTRNEEADAAYKAWRRRETLKQCSQSELLATTLLIMFCIAELICDQDLLLNLESQAKRAQAFLNFAQTLALQIFALWGSHAIVKYKEKQEVKDQAGKVMSLPANKRYHGFLTHKKELKETEEWAVHVKDQLSAAGYACFFDVDNLKEINQDVLNAAIRDSCVLFVLLDNLTFNSKWCRDEVAEAGRQNIPIRFIVHTDRFMTRALIDQWYQQAPDTAKLVFAEQGERLDSPTPLSVTR
jgi:hypothetical protein